MVATVILVEATPRNPADGSAVTVRLAGGGFRVPYAYGGYTDWRAGIVALPTFIASLEFDGGEFPAGSIPSAAEIVWAPASRTDLATVAALMWIDAPITVRIGAEGAALPAVALTGRVLDATVENGQMKLSLADPATALKKPLLTTRYAGTGGLEGPVEWQGLIRKRVFGRVWNLRAEPIDKANNVYCLADPTRKIQSLDAVRDKGAAAASLTTLGWAGSVAATFAALQAAAAPTGGGVICPSIACIKWWTQPAGDLCADLKGEVGAGYVETTAEIAKLLVDAITGPAFATGTVAAAVTARPAPVGWVAKDENTTVAAMLDDLLGNSSLIWLLSGAGEIVIRQWTFGSSVANATSQDVTRKKQLRPVATRKVGYQRNELPMNRGDLAAIVLVADVSGLTDWATYPGTIGSVTAPASNLFPYPRGTSDGRAPSAYGWGNTAPGSGWAVLGSGGPYGPFGGNYYQTTRSSGAAITITPYFDVSLFSPPGQPYSVSLGGYAANGTFQPYFYFVNAGGAQTGTAAYMTLNATTNRWEGSLPAQPGDAVKLRVLPQGTFANTGGYQDLTFYAIKVEPTPAPTPYNEDGAVLTGGNIQWNDGSTLNTLKPATAGATRNIVTYSGSAPATPADGDLWVDISGAFAIFKLRSGGAWVTGANALSAYNALSGKPVALADINTTESSKLAGIAAGADVTINNIPPNVSVAAAYMYNPTSFVSFVGTTYVALNACTVTTPGASYTTGTATITGLASSATYAIFWDLQTSTYVAINSGGTPYYASTRYLYMTTITTQATGGTGGSYGGGGGGRGGGNPIP